MALLRCATSKTDQQLLLCQAASKAARQQGRRPAAPVAHMPYSDTTSAEPVLLLGQVKVICNSGGHFVRLPKGAFEYQGGETRLVSVRSGCNHKELLSALDRVMACPHRSGSSDSEGVSPGPRSCFFAGRPPVSPAHSAACLTAKIGILSLQLCASMPCIRSRLWSCLVLQAPASCKLDQ